MAYEEKPSLIARMEILVPWGKSNPLALTQQMQARIKSAMDEGREVGLIACVIEQTERDNNAYTCTSSAMRGEIALMAAHEVKLHVLKLME